MWKLYERFVSRVDVRGPDECWPWIGSRWRGEYGTFSMKGVHYLASRVSYEFGNGRIPSSDAYHGMVVMHRCDNPICVNPRHLKLGTQRENVQDMNAKGRANRANSPKGSAHGMTDLTDEQVAEIRSSTESHSAIGRRLGMSAQRIHYIRRVGWKMIEPPAIEYIDGRKERSLAGEANKNARLTIEDIRAIRASTEKPGIVAKRFNIIPDYVTMIRKRKVWKHIE